MYKSYLAIPWLNRAMNSFDAFGNWRTHNNRFLTCSPRKKGDHCKANHSQSPQRHIPPLGEWRSASHSLIQATGTFSYTEGKIPRGQQSNPGIRNSWSLWAHTRTWLTEGNSKCVSLAHSFGVQRRQHHEYVQSLMLLLRLPAGHHWMRHSKLDPPYIPSC